MLFPKKGGTDGEVTDKLNTPKALVVASALSLIVGGSFFTVTSLRGRPSQLGHLPPDSCVVAANKGQEYHSGEQVEPTVKERDDEADQPSVEEKGVRSAEETELGSASVPTINPPIPAQSADLPTLVAAENAVGLPTPVPALAYPEHTYEEECP